MKKLFVLMCLMLLMVPTIAFARTVSAYGQYYSSVSSVNHNYNKYQIVRVGGNGFTRTVEGVRHNFTVKKIDGTARKVTFEERARGQVTPMDVSYDTNNLGTLVVGTNKYAFQVDMKRKSISISYGYTAATI